ncbi:Npt1/Npt2 family nucleotide transporter [Rickettsiales endosymbiont of Stachyamoeba lipophora]|uniref:Npt1/Npt2 family nucleotide transporter n=1 Tax=Rickettsiales endosymbiont of Stachyamoeba lipophora TaxID=2486578 RepID=UPI000F649C42|nr:Npt1/Npt2 family nucleotide transporter [Rickettsiales endosymbiont of Stachyamoeba lipophora]AZL15093.1 hypothetical protein EF513_00750 [Rickettsiales endosymbiont of Stachyamoeba lipophora]
MQLVTDSPFTKFVTFFFPIHRNERKKFLLMTFLMFSILYIYSTLRAIRDSIIVPELGSIYLTFIDLYFVGPISILFSILYAKLTNSVRREYIFYFIIGFYFIAINLFGFVFYPNIEYFHMSDETINQISDQSPNFKFFVVLIGKWCFTFWGVLVEMWMPITFILLFWQFANHVISSDQARRFYPTFGILGNFSHIFSGQVIKITSKSLSTIAFIHFNMFLMSGFMIAMVGMFYLVNRHVSVIYHNKIDMTSKLKLPIKESIKVILSSKYLLYVFTMIVGYGVINNILEIQWKSKLNQLYTDTNQYAHFMGNFSIMSGVTLIILSIVSSNVVRRAKWRTAAKIPAFIALLACLTFYPLNVFEEYISPTLTVYISSYLHLLCIVSTASILMMKCSKFTFFDNTREMVYIPLEPELKVKGKAVVDLLGSKFTIAGGSFLQSSIIMLFPMINQKLYSGILGCFSLVMAILWLTAINKLNKEYNSLLIKKINNSM